METLSIFVEGEAVAPTPPPPSNLSYDSVLSDLTSEIAWTLNPVLIDARGTL